MKFVVFSAFAASLAFALTNDATPLGKVIEMLNDMKLKGEKDKKEEEVQFAAYKQFCEITEEEKNRVIADSKDKIEVVSAELEKSEADAAKLAEEIMGHSTELESVSAEKEAAQKLRATEREEFDAMLKDYTESVEAIGRALKELKAKSKAGSLVQLKTLKLPEHASRGLHALLAEGFEDKLLSSIQDPSYEFQSGGILSMLEKLEDQFVDERLALEKEETSKKHAYELLSASLIRKMEEASKEKQQKEGFKAKKLQEKASASGELTETKAGLKTDEEYLKELVTTCTKKAADFKDRQKVRAEELVAISEATKAISEITSAGLLQQAATLQATSLAELRSESVSPVQVQVARFLQSQATEINSRVLSAMAQRARADPMGKVKQMIEQLIVRLKDQANEETTKKAWCDAELKTNKAAREEKGDAASSLQAEMDKLQAEIGKLEEETTGLSAELTELATAVKTATELRQKEKTQNEATVKEAKEGQDAVAKATEVLKDFYAKAGAKPALLQTGQRSGGLLHEAPKIFGDEAYSGMQGAKGGVLSMLEVIEADFSRMEVATNAGEAAAAKEHDAFVEESKITEAEKSKEVEHKTTLKREKSSELLNLKADFEGTEKELAAAESYYEKLKPDCLDAGPSYAERKARREEEMKDLKEALAMLDAALA